MKLLPSPKPITADYLINRILTDDHFCFTRYNDGEWFAILGKYVNEIYHSYRNCDGCEYIDGLCEDLYASLCRRCLYDQKNFIYARGGGKWRDQQNEFLVEHKLTDIRWRYSDPLKVENNKGQLKPFLDALRQKKVLFVGPKHLEDLAHVIRCDITHLDIPTVDCWRFKADIIEWIKETAKEIGSEIILFAAGMATNVFIDQLAHHIEGCSLLDVGAMFDIYVGRESRSVFRNEDWTERLAANLA